MPILLNGGTNPGAIRLNNADVSTAYHRFSSGSYTKVWEKATHPVVSDVITVVSGDFKAWIRDLEFVSQGVKVIINGVLYDRFNYSGDCTVEIPLTIDRQLGMTNSGNFTIFDTTFSPSTAVSGMPSDCLLGNLDMTGSPTIGLGVYNYTTAGGQVVIGSRQRTGMFSMADNAVVIYNYARLMVSLTYFGDYVVINDLLEKWIYQGGCSVTLIRPATGLDVE